MNKSSNPIIQLNEYRATKMKIKFAIFIVMLISFSTSLATASEPEPAEISIGERLFQEIRFAQAWYARPGTADHALAKTITTYEPLNGKFANGTMSCRACHMVEEHEQELSMRTYADFASTTPIPNRNDGKSKTERNSMSLVNISKADIDNILFHFDGEFNTLDDLVVGTFTGRNFGWKTSESNIAVKHIANIVRNDNGDGELAKEFGGSYAKVLKGTDTTLKKEFRLSKEYRIDVSVASDQEIVNAIAKLVTAYIKDLSFSKDENGLYNGSPYDAFLALNKLPRSANNGESIIEYNKRLLNQVNQLKAPIFVSTNQGKFETHSQPFVFSNIELEGLKLFLNRGSQTQRGGNCVSCHQAPHFTDFGFHNSGISQNQYDALHGSGAFNKIKIPDLAERNRVPGRYLPASSKHPNAQAIFRSVPQKNKPSHTDLGLWNIALNKDITRPQKKIKAILCSNEIEPCDTEMMLSKSLAAFKTPSLRDIGHSAPYMHTGELNTLQEVIAMYIKNSALAKQGLLRNTDDEMLKINLEANDIQPLLAFLRALNEDYD